LSTTAPTIVRQIPRTFPAVLAGLTAGICDLTAAFITAGLRGVKPLRLLQTIASGLLGAKSFESGWATATLGAALHFLIALSAAGIFYAASRQWAFLTKRPVLSGALYGFAVYLFMYWIVVPLSACHRGPFSITATIVAIITHVVCVGLPISLIVRRYSGHSSLAASKDAFV
jgi:hypothetical protein